MQITIRDPVTSRDLNGLQEKVRGDILNIRLTGNPRWRFMAEAELLSLLVTAGEVGSKVFLHLGSATAKHLPQSVERQMTETLPGILLGHFSNEVFGASERKLKLDVREAQLKKLTEDAGIVSSGHEAAAVAVDRFGAPRVATLFDAPNPTISGQEIEKILRSITGSTLPCFADLRYVIHFLSELVQNTRDHAMHDLTGKRIDGARFFTARRINLHPGRPLDWFETADEVISSYFRALRDKKIDVDGILELTVSDSGVGIAAKLSGDGSIYDSSIDRELSFSTKAFDRNVSSKSLLVPGRGQGLANVLTYVDRLRALLILRGGRLLLFADRLNGQQTPSSRNAFTMHERPFIRGTTVSVLVPWKAC